jgi:hypothetical protein
MFNSTPQNVDLNSTALPTGGLLGMATTPQGGLLGALHSPEMALLGSALMSAGHWVGTPVNLGQSIGNALMNASKLRQQQFQNQRDVISQNFKNKLLQEQTNDLIPAQVRSMDLGTQLKLMQFKRTNDILSALGVRDSSGGANGTMGNNGENAQTLPAPGSNEPSYLYNSNVSGALPGAPAPAGGGGSLPLSSSDVNSIQAKTAGMPLTIPTGNQQTPVTDIADQQQQAIAKAKQQAVLYGMLGMPQVGAANIYAATKGTPTQDKLAGEDVNRLKSANDAVSAAATLSPMLDEYEKALNQMPAIDSWPIVRSVIAPHLSTDFQNLQNITRRMMPVANKIFQMPSKGYTNMEMGNLLQAMGDPKSQNRETLFRNIEAMRQIIQNTKDNYNGMNDYFSQKKTLMGYQPVQFGNSNTSATPNNVTASTVSIQAPDGKIWSIPADKVDEALKRGAKRVG